MVARSRAAPSLRLSSHAYPEFSVQLLSVAAVPGWLEVTGASQRVVAQPLRIAGGSAVTPDVPGAGMMWREPW